MLVLRTSNFQGPTIRPIVPRHKQKNVHRQVLYFPWTGSTCIYGLLTKCEVKMAGYWQSSFFCVFMDRDGVEVHKHAKKSEANIQPS